MIVNIANTGLNSPLVGSSEIWNRWQGMFGQINSIYNCTSISRPPKSTDFAPRSPAIRTSNVLRLQGVFEPPIARNESLRVALFHFASVRVHSPRRQLKL